MPVQPGAAGPASASKAEQKAEPIAEPNDRRSAPGRALRLGPDRFASLLAQHALGANGRNGSTRGGHGDLGDLGQLAASASHSTHGNPASLTAPVKTRYES